MNWIKRLCYISKILKIESNSQHTSGSASSISCCVISQRYSKLKAIHNVNFSWFIFLRVVLYLKDTQNWKQFTTRILQCCHQIPLCYISKILKIESNSQRLWHKPPSYIGCVISQRYSKLKAIHNSKLFEFCSWMLCYISKILKIESNSQRE